MDLQKLVRMANQIAANLDCGDEETTVAAVADHLRRFWTPLMLDELADGFESGEAELCDAAARAVERLVTQRRAGTA
ncbi:MAG TPA: formate dehydrogenase subunit delta [Pseudomonadales bacterium]